MLIPIITYFLSWLQSRLKEPSTAAGLAMILDGASQMLTVGDWKNPEAVGKILLGVIAVVKREGSNRIIVATTTRESKDVQEVPKETHETRQAGQVLDSGDPMDTVVRTVEEVSAGVKAAKDLAGVLKGVLK